MNFYFAPLEGITNYIYRNTHAQIFGTADKYFTPFLSPNKNMRFSNKELKDILPQNNNRNINLVPQLLTNNYKHFLCACEQLSNEFGYNEINLNLGCPSMTVVSKRKGSGFLTELNDLDEFLYNIYNKSNVNISIKTRLGRYNTDEFEKIIEIFNKYPIYELIIHPRIQTDFYKNPVDIDAFEKYIDFVKAPLCYNGDIFDKQLLQNITKKFDILNSVMIGRGLIKNPALIRDIKTGKSITIDEFKKFHDNIYFEYKQNFYGENPVIHKMKELWFYMKDMFFESDDIWKKIKKIKNLKNYDETVKTIFEKQFVNM